jgi:transposase
MSTGKRRQERQGELWIAANTLLSPPSHPFYSRLASVLDKHGFDESVEAVCRAYYADSKGRPSIPPGIYFRMLMIGCFEGIDSERGICWKVDDSRSPGAFLGLGPAEAGPTHVSLANTRRRLPVETHQEVFNHVLVILAKEGLLRGKTLGIDATTLEANAALRSLVRKDTGDDYQEYLRKLAEASGIETPTKEELLRFDRARKGKKLSHDDWKHPHDPDARVGMTKQGACDMIHKCEAASDLDTGAVVSICVHAGDLGDTATVKETLSQASTNLESTGAMDADAFLSLADFPASEVVTDKGYHSGEVLEYLDGELVRSYISEPERGRRKWIGKEDVRDLTYANRRRVKGKRGKSLFRLRAELCERGFAHLFTTGGMRRVFLRLHENIVKRLPIHACGFNLGLVMRKLYHAGTPRMMAERVAALAAVLLQIISIFRHAFTRSVLVVGFSRKYLSESHLTERHDRIAA